MDKAKYFQDLVQAFDGPYRDIWVTPWSLNNKKNATDFDYRFGTQFSCRYHLPMDLSSDKLWILIQVYTKVLFQPQNKAKLEDVLHRLIYEPLAAAYPKFKGLDDQYLDVLRGVASEYNPDDIYEYCTIGGLMHRSAEYREQLHALEEKLGTDIQFAPAQRTLDRMCRHFGVPIPQTVQGSSSPLQGI